MAQRLRALEKLTTQLGYDPEPEEAAQRLGWTVEAVEDVRAARHVVVSLDAPVGDGEVELGALIAATTGHPQDEIDDGALASLLSALTPRERQVLTLRLGLDGGEPETQLQTARRLGARRSEVRRLEEYALRKLRLAPGVASLAAA
jgi:DNA-directed RNA polymerase sigma subunit (sigma70/sigma32)